MAGLAATAASSQAAGPRPQALPGTAFARLQLAQAPAAAATPGIEANLARLHQQLAITPAQQPRFEAFANAMRENARMTPGAPRADATAVDDLQLAIEDSELELTALKRLLPPMQALYASLSPAQQKTANEVFRRGPE